MRKLKKLSGKIGSILDRKQWTRRQTIIYAGIMFLTLWLASGKISLPIWHKDSPETPPKVLVKRVQVTPHQSNIEVVGTIKPSGRLDVKSLTSGTIVELPVYSGKVVETGEILVKLSAEGRERALESASALLREKTELYEIDKELSQMGYRAKVNFYSKRTDLANAAENYEKAKAEYDKITIRAPFDAFVSSVPVDPHEAIGPSTLVATLFPTKSFKVDVYLSARDVAKVKKGYEAVVTAPNGARFNGTVSRVDVMAAPDNKMYKASVKVKIDEEQSDYPFKMLGSPCRVIIYTGDIMGFIAPVSALSMSEEGVPGVKAVVDNTVVFFPIDTDHPVQGGFIITSVPQEIDLIIRGANFVRAGSQVAATTEQNIS